MFTRGKSELLPGDSRIRLQVGGQIIADIGDAPYWHRFTPEDDANAHLIASTFNAATKLHDSGYDAQQCIERLPEIVEALAIIEGITIRGPFVGAKEGMAEHAAGLTRAKNTAAAALSTLRTPEQDSET